jgi:hypothetical protein
VSINILVGQDSYWSFIEQDLIRLDDGPVAQETKFGWVVSGSWKKWQDLNNKYRPSIDVFNDSSEMDLRQF